MMSNQSGTGEEETNQGWAGKQKTHQDWQRTAGTGSQHIRRHMAKTKQQTDKGRVKVRQGTGECG